MVGSHTHTHTHKQLKRWTTHTGLSTAGALRVIYRAQVHHWKVNFVFDQQNILPVCPGFSQNIKWDHLHLWSEWWHTYTICEIKGPAQVKADWQQYCLEGLHFIFWSPLWPQALWQRGQCQYLRMLIKKDKPTFAVARLSSGESYLVSPASYTAHTHAI